MSIDGEALEARFLLLFGKRVAFARRRLGMTQADVASKVGLARPSIANIESGRQNPPLYRVHRLAQTLQLEIGDLLNNDPLEPIILIVRMKSGRYRAEIPDGDYIESTSKTTVVDLAGIVAERRGMTLVDATDSATNSASAVAP